MKLTFKEYLESKHRLLEAIKSSPVQQATYDVNKYCKLVVQDVDEKITILLKPSQQIVVEWKYEDLANPLPVGLKIEDKKNPFTESVVYTTKWKGSKLREWLNKNTSELNQ
jgi:hypothetical protein